MRSDTGVLLERADLLLAQGRFEDAEKQIREALSLEPENDYALSLLGRCFFDSKRFDEGIAVMRNAIAIDPENSFYYYLLGFGYYHKNIHAEAIGHLEKAIRLYPYEAAYYGLLSFIYIEQRAFEAALHKANEGLAIDAENTHCLNARSTALNKLGRVVEAMETMQDALAADPDNEMTHSSVGWNLLEKGKHREANKHFLEALRIDPNHHNSRLGLKESLKSKVPPYRWLLQYSFWMQNKGRSLQRAMPFIFYALFRVLTAVFNSNENTAGLTWIVVALYILFVVTTWMINSIANFFLLFNPLGKHALTVSEKWSAISSVTALVLGLIIMSLAYFTVIADGTVYEEGLFVAGLVCMSLGLPLSAVEYPVQRRGYNWRQWYTLLLAATGFFSVILFVISPETTLLAFGVYGVAFIIYNWVGVAR
jgi:tetratricopeptide (TPR) repeat protein